MMGPDWDWKELNGMQSNLSDLPAPKQRELAEVVATVRAHAEVEMIILYGSYARGTWKEEKDLPRRRWSGHASDYDILVITATAEQARDVSLWSRAEQACNDKKPSARVNLIAHSIDDVNEQIGEGRYFFTDIKREGRLLYDYGEVPLAEPRELTPAEKQRIAQGDFDRWFTEAKEFFIDYENAVGRGNLVKAAFYLNQATELTYKCILLVFTGYCPHEHLLGEIGSQAARHGPVYQEIFPRDTREADERFKLLDKAYIAARYHKSFPVFPQDLDYLAPRVQRLLEVTEAICRAHIAALGRDDESG